MRAAKTKSKSKDRANVGAFADAAAAPRGSDQPQQLVVPIHLIDVKRQVRELFETEDSTLKELSQSIRLQGVLQPILLRRVVNRYELVAGERRLRASKLAGLTELPAYVRVLDDGEAMDAQFAENVHHLNLRQIEEAKKLKRDLDSLGGDYNAVCAKNSKSKSWVSKRLALLNLPPETQRIVDRRLSGDIELIATVRQIEKINPAKAREVVDTLQAQHRKLDARAVANRAKDEVKPSKKVAGTGGARRAVDATMPPDYVAHLMATAYDDLFKRTIPAKRVLARLTVNDAVEVEAWLTTFWDMGRESKQLGLDVMRGFRDGHFATDGVAAVQLSAFLTGASCLSQPRDGIELDLLAVFTALQV